MKLLIMLSVFIWSLQAVQAGVLQEWTFDDAAGLSSAEVQAANENEIVFSGAFAGGQADGQGGFVIQGDLSGATINVDLPGEIRGQLFMRIDSSGWNVKTKSAFNAAQSKAISFLLAKGTDNVRIDLRHKSNGKLHWQGMANGAGSESLFTVLNLPESCHAAISAVLQLDINQKRYRVIGNNGTAWKAGSWKNAPEKLTRVSDFRIRKGAGFFTDGRSLTIDRIILATEIGDVMSAEDISGLK